MSTGVPQVHLEARDSRIHHDVGGADHLAEDEEHPQGQVEGGMADLLAQNCGRGGSSPSRT
jgi:hypothetical protein